MFPRVNCENEVTWLLSHFVNFTWQHFSTEQTEISIEKFFGFLMFKYKERDASVGNIVGLD